MNQNENRNEKRKLYISIIEEVVFVSSDIDLLKAAESEGLQIIDPQE